MSKKNSNDHELLVTFSDLWLICRLAKRKILFIAGLFACLGLLYAITRPVEYRVKASFRDKSKSQVSLPQNSFSAILLSGGNNNNNSEALSLFESNTLLKHLVKKQNLQASISKNETQFPRLSTVFANIYVELSLFRNKQGPIFTDPPQPALAVNKLTYSGEISKNFLVKFLDEERFQIVKPHLEKAVEGKLNEPVRIQDATFTVVRCGTDSISGQEYVITCHPIDAVVKALSLKIDVTSDKDDQTLLRLEYCCGNRYQAANTLNALMDVYKEYLHAEQQNLLTQQVDYLRSRQVEMESSLQKMMTEHASALSNGVMTTGFPDSNVAMNFLGNAQQRYAQELLAIDLEIKRLMQIQKEDGAHYDRHFTKEGPSEINKIVTEIRSLKQQADSLDLALREEERDSKANSEALGGLLAQFALVKQLELDAKVLLADLHSNKTLNANLALFTDPRYIVNAWNEQLIVCQGQSHEVCLTNFVIYLENLVHLFHVQSKAIQERLTRQNIPSEFQGIDLATAKELYIAYNKEQNSIEANILQKQFIIEQMQKPDFELSSLSSVLTDPVSQEMIGNASPLILSLRDQNNRSSKELERVKDELALQKGFLAAHLSQTVDLHKVHEQLLKEKIRKLQQTTLELVQKEASLLEEHLADYIKTRMSTLLQEHTVLEEHQQELQKEMAKIPLRWISERMIDHQMELNKRMIEEITKLVESKNISRNLEVVQSAPIDLALLETQPKPPRVLLFTLLGFIIGAFIGFGFSIIQALITGVPVSEENLRLARQNVSGSLSSQYRSGSAMPLNDHDLETLRQASSFLMSEEPSGITKNVVILNAGGINPSEDLAELLTKRGLKVLLLPLFFDSSEKAGAEATLLKYLEGMVGRPGIIKGKYYDTVSSGGVSRFASELIGSKKFAELLQQWSQEYDLVIASSSSSIEEANGEYLSSLFDKAIILINGQKWHAMDHCFGDSDNKFSFIIT